MRKLFVSVCCLVLASPVFAQSGKGDAVERTLTTPDQWPIHITYYESSKGKEAPVVILLPGAEGLENSMTRKVWDSVARNLQKNDFAVVTADLRKHGDSIPAVDEDEKAKLNRLNAADYGAMVGQDLEVVKAFLVQEHQAQKLNIRKLGIAASGSSAVVASAFAANDWLKKPWNDAPTPALSTPRGQDVRAILMLSPKSTVRGISLVPVMKTIADPFKGIAVHVYFNPGSRSDASAATRIFKTIEIKGDPVPDEPRKLVEVPADEMYTGDRFLNGKSADGRPLQPAMEKNILEFFDKFVKQRDDPWKTRTSRLE